MESFIGYPCKLYQVIFIAFNLDTKSYAYLSIKKPPTKQRTTFGHEYQEYRFTNCVVVKPMSLIKLSCRAPGLS
jgi:hypothetical protein